MSGMYEQRFYDTIRAGARASATTAAPIIFERCGFEPGMSMLDVGCGEGWWSDAFATLGLEVTGIDSGHTEHRPATFAFEERSLLGPLPKGRWDVILCLEVAEHLPHAAAAALIEQFRKRADCVVFSAARPGQGGTGHINERPIAYWADLLHVAGFAVSGALRWYLWGNRLIENWYQQNMLVAIPKVLDLDSPRVPGEALFPPNVPEQMATPHDVVHPVLFDARRQR